jgi:methoxymalonate biosynthesis acyl carrier protein
MVTAGNREKIKDFILRSIHIRDFRDDDDIFALGFVNSMFAIQLVLFIEKQFQLKIEDEDLEIENFKSIDAISRLIEQKTQGLRSGL